MSNTAQALCAHTWGRGKDGSASDNPDVPAARAVLALGALRALGLALSGTGTCSATAPLTVTQGRTPPEAASWKKTFFRGNPFCAGAPGSDLILMALNSVMEGHWDE